MRFLDLFSCVGCHALGFQRAGHELVALCENNAWRQSVLRERFPGIPIYDDVKTLQPASPKHARADVCFGGPPCQQTSVASAIHGNRTGSSLWPWMLRAGLHAGAEWFVVEQPPGNKAWEAQVVDDLYRRGRHVAIFEFGACDVGAPYLRRRRYVVASTSLPRLEVARAALPSAIERVKGSAASRGNWRATAIPAFGVDAWRSEGVDERKQRIEALGDSNPPAMAEVIGLVLKEASDHV